MTLTQVQVFIMAIVLGAIFGAYRGWRREIITMAIILATVLFLLLHGIETLVELSSATTASLAPTAAAHGLSGGGGGSSSTSSQSSGGYTTYPTVVCTNAVSIATIGVIVFFTMTFLAYRIGWRWGGPAKSSNDHILGFIPGAINGGAIMFYCSRTIFQGETITLLSPTGQQAGEYLPLVIIAAFVTLIVLLLIASQSRKPSGTGGAAH